jgi:hypothetical protein
MSRFLMGFAAPSTTNTPARVSGSARLLRRPEIWAALLALLLGLQIIPHSQPYGDDYIHLGILEGRLDHFGSPPWALYTFMDGSREEGLRKIKLGPVPWFSNPETRVRFLRPLSSGLLALDHALFGTDVRGFRVQAIFWYVALVLALGSWLRRTMPASSECSSRIPILFALLMFAASDSHWLTVYWNATRWVLVASTLAALGAVAHLRWVRDRRQPDLFLSVAAYALGLLSGEVALAVMAYPAAQVMAAAGGSVKDRFRHLLPVAAPAAIYLALYATLGFGSAGSQSYVSPLSDLSGYLQFLPGRFLAICAEVFLWVPSGWWSVESLRPRVVLAGAAGLALTAAILAPVFRSGSRETRRIITAWASGSLMSMLPLAAGEPSSRNILIPFIGASALLGMALHHWSLKMRQGRQPVAAAAVSLGLIALHLLLPLYRWVTEPATFGASTAVQARQMRALDVTEAGGSGQRTVFLTMHFSHCWHGYFLRTLEGLPMPEGWWILSAADSRHRYTRTAADRLVLETPDREMFTTQIERAIRHPGKQLREGELVQLTGMRVTVLEIGEAGPVKVEFAFDRSLDDRTIRLMAVLEGELRRVDAPEVGESILIPSPW